MATSRVSEAFVLRTYPLREADLIVSFFTRDLGKLRGVARRARKPGSQFGSGLERLSLVRMHHFHRENRDLDTLDGCELIRSRFELSDYDLAVALDFVAELSELLLPPGEANEKFFRLLIAVTDYLAQTGRAGLWPAVNYFALWAVRLAGILAPVELTEEDHALAEEILRTPISKLSSREWSRPTAAGLRRQLVHLVEEHVERRLITVQYLEALD
ncbi:MAG: DNA repair protein RecO [Bryobacteraceae bacterium]